MSIYDNTVHVETPWCKKVTTTPEGKQEYILVWGNTDDTGKPTNIISYGDIIPQEDCVVDGTSTVFWIKALNGTTILYIFDTNKQLSESEWSNIYD